MTTDSHKGTLTSLLEKVELVTGSSVRKRSSAFLLSFDENETNSIFDDTNIRSQMEDEAANQRVPRLPNVEDGLDSINSDALRQCVEPIWNSLENIDAEDLLALKRVTAGTGARLHEGIDIRPIYDEITPSKNYLLRNNGSCVRYLHIAEKYQKYSIGIFVFHPYARMPLHDHPEMCVLSRILYGDVSRKSLDLMEEGDDEDHHHPPIMTRNSSSSSWLSNLFPVSNRTYNTKVPENAKRACKREVEYLKAPDVTMLFPYKGNLHEFVAGPNGAAVLDVLLPPYGDSRDCTFYTVQDEDDDESPSSATNGTVCWIIPSEQPDNFHCLSGEYYNFRDDE